MRAGHYAGLAERTRVNAHLLRRHAAMAELITLHGAESTAHAHVAPSSIDVGESVRTVAQWADAAEVVMNVGDVDHVHAVDAAAIPREEAVARPARQPADASEAAADAPAASAKPEERDISRRPQRTVSDVHRTGPPAPIAAINEPTSIVIRRPAPRLIGNPGPAIIRFKDPAPIAIRRPVRTRRRKPHVAVVRDVGPMSVGIKILAAGVVRIGVLPALRAFDDAVAIAIPLVPVIAE